MAVIPGQWKVFTLDSGPVVVRSTDGDTEYMVARCYGDGDGDQISTATLIAAAPDLLAALRLVKAELIDPYVEHYPGDDIDEEIAKAIGAAAAAIAKAEGRE